MKTVSVSLLQNYQGANSLQYETMLITENVYHTVFDFSFHDFGKYPNQCIN